MISRPHAHAQWIVKTSGAKSLIEISNWLVGGPRSGVYSYWLFHVYVPGVAAAAVAAATNV